MVRRGKNKCPDDERPDSPAGKSSGPGRENTHDEPNHSGNREPDSPAKIKDSGDKPESPAGKSSDPGRESAQDRFKHSGDRIPDLPAGESSDTGHEEVQGTPPGSMNEVCSVAA